MESEILIVDEVSAVGDAAFRTKCLGKMGDVPRKGQTVLLVSHDRYLIREVCDSLVAVRDGSARYHPTVEESIISPRGKAATASPPVVAAVASAPPKRSEADRRNARYAATKDVKKRIERLERDLGQAESAVAELHRQMADPEVLDVDVGKAHG